MSWTTTAVRNKSNIPTDFEFNNWNEENLGVALDWVKLKIKSGWIVTIYHNTIQPQGPGISFVGDGKELRKS